MLRAMKIVLAGLTLVIGFSVVALPSSDSYAANPQNVDVNLTISAALGAYTICSSAVNSGIAANTVGTVTCTVSASSNSGVAITIRDWGGSLDLESGSNAIPTIAATANLASLTAGVPGWGYRFAVTADGASGSGLAVQGNYGNYNGVTATDVTVATSSVPVANAMGTFTFAASTSMATPAGTYTNVVVIGITATNI